MAAGPADRRTTREIGREGAVTRKNGISDSIHLFSTQAAWTAWLEKNHRKSSGLWLRLAKKGSDLKSVTYGEALEVALCYGWIDGQKRGESEHAWLQRFLPRSAKSIWSKINREKALALIATGSMRVAGHEAIDAARKNGTGRPLMILPSRPRFRRTSGWRSMPAHERGISSRNSTAQTVMQSCFGFKSQRKSRLENGKFESSSQCLKSAKEFTNREKLGRTQSRNGIRQNHRCRAGRV